MDIIVNTSNVDQFITDSILQCIKLLEIPAEHLYPNSSYINSKILFL